MKLVFGLLLVVVAFMVVQTAKADGPAAAKKAQEGDFPAAELPPVVHAEYNRTQGELQKELSTAKKKLADLEAAKTAAFARAQQLAQAETAGIDSIKQFEVLLVQRYSNDKGEFVAGRELETRDVETINKLFQGYLHWSPLQGRVSAGQARKTIETGLERLGEIAKTHGSPSESNNSDYEIIAFQTKEAETQVARIMDQAGKLGLQLNEHATGAVADAGSDAAPAPKLRAPASGDSQKKH